MVSLQKPRHHRAGIDPLLHYLRFGAAEGRDPHPLFSNNWYKAQHPEVEERGLNPLAYYVTEGMSSIPTHCSMRYGI